MIRHRFVRNGNVLCARCCPRSFREILRFALPHHISLTFHDPIEVGLQVLIVAYGDVALEILISLDCGKIMVLSESGGSCSTDNVLHDLLLVSEWVQRPFFCFGSNQGSKWPGKA